MGYWASWDNTLDIIWLQNLYHTAYHTDVPPRSMWKSVQHPSTLIKQYFWTFGYIMSSILFVGSICISFKWRGQTLSTQSTCLTIFGANIWESSFVLETSKEITFKRSVRSSFLWSKYFCQSFIVICEFFWVYTSITSTKRLDPTALRTSPTVKVFEGTFIPKKSNVK